jgi:hypothetical protein
MSRLHRQPRSRNARTEFPEYRAMQVRTRRRQETCNAGEAGRVRGELGV